MKEIKAEKRTEGFVGRVFLLLLSVGLLINIFSLAKKDRQKSVPPKLSWNSFASGSGIESAFRSTGTAQDVLQMIRAGLRRLGGSKKENGVLLGKAGQLFADIALPDEESLRQTVAALRAFAEKFPDTAMSIILVPDAAEILKDSLPNLAPLVNQSAMIGAVKKNLADCFGWVDAAKALSVHKNEKIYYQTDPRWTSAGAFAVFLEAARTIGIGNDISNLFAAYSVTTDFKGSLAKKSGFGASQKERIHIYVPKEGDNDVLVHYADERRLSTSLYRKENLKSSDPYSVFLGGDFSLVDIKTLSPRQNHLLLVKDSFGNCFVPFLAPFFREIVAVDPVYFSGSLLDLMDSYQITDVIFLYEGNAFFRDHSLSEALKIEQSDRAGVPSEEGTNAPK